MWNELTEQAGAARQLVLAVAVVAWLGASLGIAVMRKSILAGIGTFIAGGFLVAGMYQSDLIRTKTETDIVEDGAPVAGTTVVSMDAPVVVS